MGELSCPLQSIANERTEQPHLGNCAENHRLTAGSVRIITVIDHGPFHQRRCLLSVVEVDQLAQHSACGLASGLAGIHQVLLGLDVNDDCLPGDTLELDVAQEACAVR